MKKSLYDKSSYNITTNVYVNNTAIEAECDKCKTCSIHSNIVITTCQAWAVHFQLKLYCRRSSPTTRIITILMAMCITAVKQ